MVARLGLAALGVPLRISADDGSLLTELGDLLADLANPAGPPADPHADVVEIRLAGRGPWEVTSAAHSAVATTRAAATGHLHAAVNLGAVAATRLLAFHAAVLARGDRTVVIPGRSGMGKTTLTAALLMRGWEYVSDEALALPWAWAGPLPYPRPLGLSDWTCQALGITAGIPGEGESFARAADLGASVRWDPRPVTDILVLEHGTPAFAAAEVRPAAASEVLAALLPRAFTVHHDGGRALPVLGDLVRSARMHTVLPGSPADTADRVDALV